tara:strand:+ start:1634 stop:4963 length:3330 start_codon:yes stop_codon:yes gene_type:complete
MALTSQEQEFLDARAAAADELRNRPLTETQGNRTYGSVLNQEDRERAAVLLYPRLNSMAQTLMGPDKYEEYIAGLDLETRIKRYNLPPIDYSNPQFEQSLTDYEKSQEELEAYYQNIDPRTRALQMGVTGTPVPSRRKPFRFGYDESKIIGNLGVNPEKEIDIEGFNVFRSGIALGAPRNVTPKDLNYAKENLGVGPLARRDPNIKSEWSDKLPGDFAYIDPSLEKTSAIAYFEEGKEPAMFDPPTISAMDAWELFLQEAPVLTTEIFIGAKGLTKLDDFLKAVPRNEITKVNRIMDSVTGNVLLAGGAATTNLLQRFTGLAYGAHDRGLMDMVVESGWLFLLAYAGNQTVDAFLNGVPKLYRVARGKDIDPAEIVEIRTAIERIRESKQGKKVKTIGGQEEPVSILDIDEAIAELSAEISEKIPAYNPSLAQASKDARMADFERLILDSGVNPKYGKFYADLMEGNEETIQKFFNALYGNLESGTTAQTVGKEITNLFGRQRADFITEGEAIITGIRGRLDDFKKAGNKGLIDQVTDKRASSKLYDRFTARINDISQGYKKQLGEDVEAAITRPELSHMFSGRLFRKSLLEFKNAGKGDGLINAGGKDAAATFRGLFPEEAQVRLLKYSEGTLTLKEINKLRMDLNSYISRIDPSKDAASNRIFTMGRDLQNNIEDQMFQQIRKSLPRDEADTVIDIFNTQKWGTELANNEVIKGLMREQPESIINYLFSTGTRKAAKNTRVRSFMDFLEATDSQLEINTLRNETIDFIKNNYLDVTDASPLKLAADYKKFLRNNRGTLRELFPEEQFGKVYDTPTSFQRNIIEPLEGIDRKSKLMERTFGENNPFNIVKKILGTGARKRASGEIIDDLDMLDEILKTATDKELKIIQKQLSDATKKYLVSFSTTDDLFDVRKLNQIMDDGFGPERLVGEDLSFKGVFGRLLGDEADAFFKNLDVLRDMGMRQVTDLTTTSMARKETAEKIMDPGINYLKRFLIPPLTQFGRRVTAAEKLVGERNLRFIGDILMEPKIFDQYIGAITSRKKFNIFVRTLLSSEIPMFVDIGNTLKDYDKNRKEFITPKEEIPFYSPKNIEKIVPGITGTVFNPPGATP